jgi:hypothetical protein
MQFSANSSARESGEKIFFSSLLSIELRANLSLHVDALADRVPIPVAVAAANDHDVPGWFPHQANNWQNCIIDFNPKEATSTIQAFC